MLAAVGDLVEDVVVHLGGPINLASDTRSHVRRRRGGSASVVAAAAAEDSGTATRFIGQIGDDPIGAALVDDLSSSGVETIVRRNGRTGTIVVLVDHRGERTMLTDRGDATGLTDPEPGWLDGVTTLHVPFYSLAVEPLATTTTTLVGWAHERGASVSIDASSVAVLEEYGVARAVELLRSLRPTVLLANEAEADCLGPSGVTADGTASIAVVKQGPEPALVLQPHRDPLAVSAPPLQSVRDTTGAGDTFAAGFLVALAAGASPTAAAAHGHRTAAAAIRRASDFAL